MEARCQCGALTASVPGPSPAIVQCHCRACQRRTGAPFGVLAYYPEAMVAIAGDARRFARDTDEGNRFETFFCPTCGTTLYARTSKHPGLIGIAVGAFADPAHRAPVRSVWEEARHAWVAVPERAERHAKGPGKAG
jgi:hypothetical protein